MGIIGNFVVPESYVFFWKNKIINKVPHIFLTLRDWFKVYSGDRWYLLPIVYKTRNSIPMRRWFIRGMKSRVQGEGPKMGLLFIKEISDR